ncbi:MAG: hypothetical protein AB1925_12430 [Actinomycetota bacterium]
MRFLQRLDTYGFEDPDNSEGQPEDICTVCFGDRRIVDHPGHRFADLGDESARWPHRLGALAAMAGRKIDRFLDRLWWQM